MIICGDSLSVLKMLPDESVNCCVTSPPYWGLRDYGVEGQLGLEKTPDEYVAKMVDVFREVRRVLRNDGTLWLNLGDSYASGGRSTRDHDEKLAARHLDYRAPNPPGLKPKDLVGIPWRVAFSLQADGWYLRQDIIWAKPNPMPESVRDRCTKAHEYIFLLAKSERYYFDSEAVKEKAIGGAPAGNKSGNKGRIQKAGWSYDPAKSRPEMRNRRSVWTVTTKPFKGAHFATFPPDLIEPCVKAGCPIGGTVLDPFFGAGTTGVVSKKLGREYLGIELNPEYIVIAEKRIGAPT